TRPRPRPARLAARRHAPAGALRRAGRRHRQLLGRLPRLRARLRRRRAGHGNLAHLTTRSAAGVTLTAKNARSRQVRQANLDLSSCLFVIFVSSWLRPLRPSPYSPTSSVSFRLRSALRTLIAVTSPVLGFVGEGAFWTWSRSSPKAPRAWTSWVLRLTAGSATTRTTVLSKPIPARLTAAATLTFWGKSRTASRALPS